MCVLPNAERIDCFLRETGTRKPVMCVWNCPERHEVSEGGASPRVGTVVFYHGSLNAERLPFSVLGALAVLPESVSLQFAGYATIGRPNYVAEFLAEASRMGVRGRVTYLGAPSDRATLLRHCRQASVGMSLMPSTSRDVNLRAMVGASNKPFDYLASGLPLLVSELPEWRKVFVESGCGLACNPADAKSIASGLGWFAEHPDLAMKMAESGRKRILSDWNYESQFVPVLAALRQTL
jgi:glycosyltransferase involved in cell wall biosynthesis